MFTAAVLSALVASTFASPLGFRPADPVSLFKRISSGCSTAGAASCSSQSSSVPDTCCAEYPGGILLQTQFWDTLPSTGPSNSWTIHGLWPDNCNSTYAKNCDSSRDYTDIAALLTAQGASDTLAFMQEFNSYGTSEKLLEHEWASHGTCMSTLETSYLPTGSAKGAEAVDCCQTFQDIAHLYLAGKRWHHTVLVEDLYSHGYQHRFSGWIWRIHSAIRLYPE